MTIQVRQVMGPVAIAVREHTPFADIVAAMGYYGVGAVTVIDDGRRPVGVVSEDDLLLKESGPAAAGASVAAARRWRRERDKAAGTTAAGLMTSPAVTVTPDTPVREAARLMHGLRVRQLPVVDPDSGRLVGTLLQEDVLRVFARPPEELAADLARALGGLGTLAFEVERGVVRITGQVAGDEQAAEAAERARAVEGVVDVVCDVTAGDAPERSDA
ncbi:CBS domain-containing protein [Actinomadura sp. ATCC 31491]|uniref:CBS domain-containing protein n=1 Tax=Actinomadura luzonensis TaxID=2805427 RepID=A0ABT0FUS8_9ACTN|nr:CBS domain-containing protein [Actinomadura luzonensis]MCK2215913.1 CBS domain-containing protein [Actinomadura luzonensis]